MGRMVARIVLHERQLGLFRVLGNAAFSEPLTCGVYLLPDSGALKQASDVGVGSARRPELIPRGFHAVTTWGSSMDFTSGDSSGSCSIVGIIRISSMDDLAME